MLEPLSLPSAAELLARIPHTRTVEDRAHKRTPFACPATLIEIRNGAWCEQPICTRDISLSGLGFESPALFEKGRAVLLHLQLRTVSKLILARIVYSAALASGRYLAGAMFLEVAPECTCPTSVPQAWLDQLKAGT